jgi:hypothetical protein
VLPSKADREAPAPQPKPARRWLMPVLALVAVLFVVGVVGGGAFAFTGGFGFLGNATETVAPTRTETLVAFTATNPPPPSETAPAPTATVDGSTPTPNAVETQLASIQQTQAAIQAAVASPTPSNTPDLTATFAACTYDYGLAGQDPPDNRQLTTRTAISKTLTLRNTGTCAFPEGAVISETNLAANAAPFTVTVPAIAPEATGEVRFHWPGLNSPGTSTRSFVLLGLDSLPIGQPMTFTLRYVASATQAPPPSATPTLAPPTATTPAGGLTDIFPSAFIGCSYQGDGNMDYNCTVKVGWSGTGLGRMTLYLDGIQVGEGFQATESKFYNIVSRRCLPRAYSIRLVDDATLTQIQRDFFFDPSANGSLFPGGGCTLPS